MRNETENLNDLVRADPCVRVFAELALKEIRLGGSDVSCLLSDKGAFSEFMDKVNERYESS